MFTVALVHGLEGSVQDGGLGSPSRERVLPRGEGPARVQRCEIPDGTSGSGGAGGTGGTRGRVLEMATGKVSLLTVPEAVSHRGW